MCGSYAPCFYAREGTGKSSFVCTEEHKRGNWKTICIQNEIKAHETKYVKLNQQEHNNSNYVNYASKHSHTKTVNHSAKQTPWCNSRLRLCVRVSLWKLSAFYFLFAFMALLRIGTVTWRPRTFGWRQGTGNGNWSMRNFEGSAVTFNPTSKKWYKMK